MEKPRMLTSEQVQAYLLRLGKEQASAPTLQLLDELVYAHQCAIVFETTAVCHSSTPPLLDLDTVFTKLVSQRRGGYCFEMNLLFNALLVALGYDAYPTYCRVIQKDGTRRPLSHRGTIITLEGKRYYADVGFGGPIAAGALALDEQGEQLIQGETYSVTPRDDAWWALNYFSDEVRFLENIENNPASIRSAEGVIIGRTILEVCTARVEDQDFEALNLHNSQPGAFFWENCIINRRTPEGNCSILNNVLTLNSKGKKQVIELPDVEAFNNAAKEHFGLDPSLTPSNCLTHLYG